jgi:hypothetical protein
MIVKQFLLVHKSVFLDCWISAAFGGDQELLQIRRPSYRPSPVRAQWAKYMTMATYMIVRYSWQIKALTEFVLSRWNIPNFHFIASTRSQNLMTECMVEKIGQAWRNADKCRAVYTGHLRTNICFITSLNRWIRKNSKTPQLMLQMKRRA